MYNKLKLKLQNKDLESFTAGNHWIHNVLVRNNMINIDILEAENKMAEFRTECINKYIYIDVFIEYIF